MKISISGAEARLEGDWTLAEVTQGTIDSLAVVLQQLEAVGAGKLRVDCRHMNAIDAIGQQILNVWLQCSKLRGVEPELVNCPDTLQKIFQSLRPPSSDTATPSTPMPGKARETTRPPTVIAASSMRSAVTR